MSSVVYGAMDQEARSIHLDKFRKGKVRISLVLAEIHPSTYPSVHPSILYPWLGLASLGLAWFDGEGTMGVRTFFGATADRPQ